MDQTVERTGRDQKKSRIDWRVIWYPIGLFFVWFVIGYIFVPWFDLKFYYQPYDMTVHDAWTSVFQWTIIFSALWILGYAKYYRSRKLQLLGLVFSVQAFMLNVLGFKYDDQLPIATGSGADAISSAAISRVVGEANSRDVLMVWNPYIFCGMPTLGSLQASAPSQIRGMAVRKGFEKFISFVMIGSFFYYLFRWEKSKFEKRVFAYFKNINSSINEQNGDVASIAFWIVMFLAFYEIFGIILFGLFF